MFELRYVLFVECGYDEAAVLPALLFEGCFSFVKMSAYIELVGSQVYDDMSSSISLCFKSVITFLSVLVVICLVDAIDSSVDSKSVNR